MERFPLQLGVVLVFQIVYPLLNHPLGNHWRYLSVCGFQDFQEHFFDVNIFNPHAKSCPKTIKDAYNYPESIKKLKYEQRITDIKSKEASCS